MAGVTGPPWTDPSALTEPSTKYGRDRVILDHDGSLTGEAGTIWSFRNRGRGTQEVTDLAAPIWASRGNNIPDWIDAVNSVLQFDFTGDP